MSWLVMFATVLSLVLKRFPEGAVVSLNRQSELPWDDATYRPEERLLSEGREVRHIRSRTVRLQLVDAVAVGEALGRIGGLYAGVLGPRRGEEDAGQRHKQRL